MHVLFFLNTKKNPSFKLAGSEDTRKPERPQNDETRPPQLLRWPAASASLRLSTVLDRRHAEMVLETASFLKHVFRLASG